MEDSVVASTQERRPQTEANASATPLEWSCQLGALSKPLREQFEAQGLDLNPEVVALWQARMEAIITLRFGGVLPWGQANKAYDRLGKQIMAGLTRVGRKTASLPAGEPRGDAQRRAAPDLPLGDA